VVNLNNILIKKITDVNHFRISLLQTSLLLLKQGLGFFTFYIEKIKRILANGIIINKLNVHEG
jgi:hypothetical protein